MNRKPWEIYFFIILSVIFPLVDVANGYFLSLGNALPIGIFYRTVFFVFLLIAILFGKSRKNNYTLLTISCLLGCIGLILIQNIILQNPISYLVDDFTSLVKFFLWLLIPYYVYQRLVLFKDIHYEKLFLWISFFLTAGLLIPYWFGVGTYTYAHSNAGYKGFYYAQNDTAVGFMLALTFVGWALLFSLKVRQWRRGIGLLLLYSAVLVSLLLISMKTGILYGFLFTIGLFIYFLCCMKNIHGLIRLTIFSFSLAIFFCLLFVGKSFILEAISGTIQRMNYFYNLYDGNIFRLLTSSRSEYIKLGFRFFVDTQNQFLMYFVGFGFEYRLLNFGGAGSGGLMEMDFFDVLFGLGGIGAFLVTGLVLYFLILSCRKGNRSIYTFALIVILLYSFFAGHVMFSALCTTLLGLTCGGVLLMHAQKEEKGAIYDKNKKTDMD